LRLSTWPFVAVGILLLYRIWKGLSGFVASSPGDGPYKWIFLSLPALGALEIFLLLTLAGILVTAVHEAGHVLAGWAVGFRFYAVRVRRAQIERDGGRLRLRWIRARDIRPESRGFARLLPRDSYHLRPRLAVVFAGGPVASLLFALALFLPAYQLQLRDASQDSGPGHATLILWLAIVAGLSFLGFLLNLVPRGQGGSVSDGATLLVLLRGGPPADLHCLVYEVQGVVEGAIRLRNWPDELLARLMRLHRWDRSVFIRTWSSLLEGERIAEAGWLVIQLLHRRPDLTRELCADVCDAAALLLARSGEHAAARGFLTHAALDAADPSLHRQTEEAVDQSERRSREAAEPSGGSEGVIRADKPDTGDATANLWIEKLLAVLGTLASPGSRAASVSTSGAGPGGAPPPAADADAGAPAPPDEVERLPDEVTIAPFSDEARAGQSGRA